MAAETILGRDVGVRYAGAGPEKALLIHCSLANSGALKPVFSALDADLSMTAFDLPGHGLTDYDETEDYQDQCVAIGRELLARNTAPTHVIGHSYGATVAMRLAVDCPTQIASLTVFEPVNFAIFADDNPAAFAQELKDASDFGDAALANDWRSAARAFLLRWGMGENFDDLPLFNQDNILKTLPMVLAGADAIYNPDRGARMAAQLRELSLPTLILEGANSPAAVAINNAAIQHNMPHARREILSDAGHMGLLTHTNQVAELFRAHCLKPRI